MKIVAFADSHGRHKKIKKLPGGMPEGDVLVVAGDFSPKGEIEMVHSFANWLGKLPHKEKIVVAGNHDKTFESGDLRCLAEGYIKNVAHYLIDSEVVINGVKFYGSPWQPAFCNWAFNLPRGERLRKVWQAVPEDTDVLITHGPPMGILDVPIYKEEHVGCADLEEELGRIKPKVHIFGHIHHSYGMVEKDGTRFYNSSVVGEDYKVANPVHVIEV